MQPPPVASNPCRLSVSDFVSQLWRKSPSSVRQYPGRKAWIRGYLKTSCQNQSVLETSGWWDSVSSFNVRTATESFAAISSSPPVSVAIITPGQSQANSHCWLTQTVHLSSVAVFASNHLTISSYVELTDETSRPWLCVAVQQQAPRTSALSK